MVHSLLLEQLIHLEMLVFILDIRAKKYTKGYYEVYWYIYCCSVNFWITTKSVSHNLFILFNLDAIERFLTWFCFSFMLRMNLNHFINIILLCLTSFLRIWSYLLKISLMENFIFLCSDATSIYLKNI